jgi:hypothetical protein
MEDPGMAAVGEAPSHHAQIRQSPGPWQLPRSKPAHTGEGKREKVAAVRGIYGEGGAAQSLDPLFPEPNACLSWFPQAADLSPPRSSELAAILVAPDRPNFLRPLSSGQHLAMPPRQQPPPPAARLRHRRPGSRGTHPQGSALASTTPTCFGQRVDF